MIFYLVYFSEATHPMTDEDLTALLEQARRGNEIHNVTGMLLYKSGKFLQVLESDQDLDSLYARIARDSRHKDTAVLLSGVQSKRQFPNWSMGFANLSSMTEQALPGFTSFLSDGFNLEAMHQSPHRAYKMLLKFRQADGDSFTPMAR